MFSFPMLEFASYFIELFLCVFFLPQVLHPAGASHISLDGHHSKCDSEWFCPGKAGVLPCRMMSSSSSLFLEHFLVGSDPASLWIEDQECTSSVPVLSFLLLLYFFCFLFSSNFCPSPPVAFCLYISLYLMRRTALRTKPNGGGFKGGTCVPLYY